MFLFRVVTWIIDHPKFFIRRQPALATVSLFELLLLLNFFLFFFHNCNRLNQCFFCPNISFVVTPPLYVLSQVAPIYYWTTATVSLFELLLLLNFFLFFFHNCNRLNQCFFCPNILVVDT